MKSIRRQRDSFSYRFAADPFNPSDNKKKKYFDLGGGPAPSQKQSLDALPQGFTPDPFNAAAEAVGPNAPGARLPKAVIRPGMPNMGGGGAGSNSYSGGGSSTGLAGGVGGGGVGPGGSLGDSGGTIRPETQSTLNWVQKNHPEFSTIGGYRAPDGFNEHSSGSALDVMLPKGYDTSQAQTFISDVFKNNPSAAYILYDNRQWNPDGSTSWGISSPHTDHFHIRTVM